MKSLNSPDLAARSLAALWHPCTQMARAAVTPPLAIARGEGPWLFDLEGRRYFDANSSWWVNLFGHSDAGIRAAITHQLETLPHVMLAGCTHAPAVELAEKLSALTGGALGHAFFASVFRDAYDPLLMRAHIVDSPDARQGPGSEARALADLRRVLTARRGHVAALIIEPLVQCAAGMAMHEPSYLRAVRALCDEFDIHLIADEIAVGCGRSGTFFAFEQGECGWPDFITLSKGISGGTLPLSLVLTTETVYQSFWSEQVGRGFLHSHSYTGNALACAAANAVLDRFAADQVLEKNRVQARLLAEAFAPLATDPRVHHLRQRGMILAFDVREPGERFAERFHLAARAHELLIRPIGATVYLMPPYLIDAPTAQFLFQAVMATLSEVLDAA